MEDAEHQPRRKAAWAIAALLVTATLTLYVLSLGPAILLHNEGYISDATLTVYYPLLWLGELFPIVQDLLYWYAAFWKT